MSPARVTQNVPATSVTKLISGVGTIAWASVYRLIY
jgi:hypothetical protein